MKAFILAAGAGTRLRPLTFELPKPMIPLVNKPVLEHTIDNLKRHNVSSIMMNLHTMPELITNYFGNGENFGVEISYSKEETLLGTAGGLKKCKNFFDSTFAVMSGDGLSDVDITSAVEFHKKKKSLATMVLKKVETKFSYGITLTNRFNKIVDFVEKPSWGDVFSDTVNTGIYIFEPEIFKYIPDGFYDFGKDLWPKLLKLNKPIYAYIMNGHWTDIGNIDEYKNGTRDILEGKIIVKINGKKIKNTEVIMDTGSEFDKTVKFIGKSVIGKNCKIGKNVVIDNGTVIGDNVKIQNDAIIKDSIIWNNTVIGKKARLCSSIIGVKVPSNLSVYNGLLFNIR
ncbi:MAG: NDP-sugar synthase [Endomicrobiaceae bacterium]|nr:NDP-sugar synthase [Endomicrobiaceae bacterium]